MRISNLLIAVLLVCTSSAFAQQSVTDAAAKKPAKKAVAKKTAPKKRATAKPRKA